MNTLPLIDPAPRFFEAIGRAKTERIVRWKDCIPYMKYMRVWIDVPNWMPSCNLSNAESAMLGLAAKMELMENTLVSESLWPQVRRSTCRTFESAPLTRRTPVQAFTFMTGGTASRGCGTMARKHFRSPLSPIRRAK
jgi:hypothetical protein